MSPQYGDRRPTNGWDMLVSLGHTSKLQPISRLGSWLCYCTDEAQRRSTKLCRMSGRLQGWYTIHTFFGFCPSNGILLQNLLCVHILRSTILAALLHGTRAAAVSQTFWHGTRNGIMELSQRAPPIFGWAAFTLGISPHSSYKCDKVNGCILSCDCHFACCTYIACFDVLYSVALFCFLHYLQWWKWSQKCTKICCATFGCSML